MSLGDRIWTYIGDDHDDGDGPVERLRQYYTTKAGREFDTLDGGGDRPKTGGYFAADDVVAVALLSVSIPPDAILALLQTKRKALSDLLQETVDGAAGLPVKTNLWKADRRVVEPGSTADRLWHELEAIDGIGWVTAGKLLARKRPQLIPVFDRVVRACLMPTGSNTWWVSLYDALCEDPSIVTRLAHLKRAAELPRKVSLLRVLDVAVWMTSQPPPGR